MQKVTNDISASVQQNVQTNMTDAIKHVESLTNIVNFTRKNLSD